MIVIIVLVCVGAGVINNYLKVKADREDGAANQADLDKMRMEVERLKDRVRVLETIATDKDQRLSEEIRKLA
jgi:cell division protein FtsB